MMWLKGTGWPLSGEKLGKRYILGGKNMRLKEIFKEFGGYCWSQPPRFRMPHSAAAIVTCFRQNGHCN